MVAISEDPCRVFRGAFPGDALFIVGGDGAAVVQGSLAASSGRPEPSFRLFRDSRSGHVVKVILTGQPVVKCFSVPGDH